MSGSSAKTVLGRSVARCSTETMEPSNQNRASVSVVEILHMGLDWIPSEDYWEDPEEPTTEAEELLGDPVSAEPDEDLEEPITEIKELLDARDTAEVKPLWRS